MKTEVFENVLVWTWPETALCGCRELVSVVLIAVFDIYVSFGIWEYTANVGKYLAKYN